MFRFWIIGAALIAFLIGKGWYVAFSPDLQDQSKGSDQVVVSNSQHPPQLSNESRAGKAAPPTMPSKIILHGDPAVRPSVGSLHQAKEYEEARSTLVERIKSTPEDESLIEELAFLLADKLGEKGEARLLFQQLLELNPENSLALGLYKDLSTDREAKAQATEFLASQADRCRSCFDIQLVAADLLIDAHRSDEAIALLDFLNESSLAESQARHLSSLYRRLGQNDLAHSWLQRAIGLASNAEPKSSQNHVSSAWRNHDRAMLRQLANDSGQGI